jgi:hypothetical protein
MLRNPLAKLTRMPMRLCSTVVGLLDSHRGQAFAEYAIMLSLLVLVLITALASFGHSVSLFLIDAACYISLRGGC